MAISMTFGKIGKYRAGDWRLVASIHDRVLMIEMIEIVHRSSAY